MTRSWIADTSEEIEHPPIPIGLNEMAVPRTMMILSFVLSLCSTSDAFIASQMLSFSASAKLAFLTYGPMMDVKLVFMYGAIFKPKFVMMMAISLFVAIAIIFGQWGNIPVPGT